MSRISNRAIAGLSASILTALMSQTALAGVVNVHVTVPAVHVHVPAPAVHIRAPDLSVRQASRIGHHKSYNRSWEQSATVKQPSAVRHPTSAEQIRLPPMAIEQAMQSITNFATLTGGSDPEQDLGASNTNIPTPTGGSDPEQDLGASNTNLPTPTGGNGSPQKLGAASDLRDLNLNPYSGGPGSGPYGGPNSGGSQVAAPLMGGRAGMVSEDPPTLGGPEADGVLTVVPLVHEPTGTATIGTITIVIRGSSSGTNQTGGSSGGSGGGSSSTSDTSDNSDNSTKGGTNQPDGNCNDSGCGSSEPGDNVSATGRGAINLKAIGARQAQTVDPGPDPTGLSGSPATQLMNASRSGHGGDFGDVGGGVTTPSEIAAMNRMLSAHVGD